MQNFRVDKKYDGKQLSKVLLDTFSGLALNTLYKALRKKDIRINDIRTNQDTIVHYGDEVTVYIIDELLYQSFIPEIVYEDDNILVVNKPSGIEVVGEKSLTNDLRYFLAQSNHSTNTTTTSLPFLEPCHRLDRNTTGLVLFAKNGKSLDILLNKFKIHEIEKHYLAKVYGIPKVASQTLISYLFKDSKKSLVYISDEPQKGYVKIITSYYIIEKNVKENYSILDVCLYTGKTHQIRAHLAHIGHPILGDGKYGNNQINKQFGYKTQQLCSYILKFNFKEDSGILNYLNGKEIKLKL